jgi:hypothetical protein
MRWFMDTEFAENGSTIKLISIALVSEDGHEYYRALLDGWSADDCDDWVKANVLPKLPNSKEMTMAGWATRDEVAKDLHELLLNSTDLEIWGYFSDYDWVVFCQLFGRMVDLPAGFPMFCLDLKQEMHRLGVTKDDPMFPKQENAHDALADARWIRDAWACLEEG